MAYNYRPYIKKGVRSEVLARDGLGCVYCGAPEHSGLDHVRPHHDSGDNSADNLVPACASCNSSKGRESIEEWQARLSAEHKRLGRILRGIKKVMDRG